MVQEWKCTEHDGEDARALDEVAFLVELSCIWERSEIEEGQVKVAGRVAGTRDMSWSEEGVRYMCIAVSVAISAFVVS